MSPVNGGSPYTLPEVNDAPRYYSACLGDFVLKRNRHKRFRTAGKTTVMKVGVPLQITREDQYVVVNNVGVDIKIQSVERGWKATVDFSSPHAHSLELTSFGKTTVLCKSSIVLSARPIINLSIHVKDECVGSVCKHTHKELASFMKREYTDGSTAWAAPVNGKHVVIIRRQSDGQFFCDGCRTKFANHKTLSAHLNISFSHKFQMLSSSGYIDTVGQGPKATVPPQLRWTFPINGNMLKTALKKIPPPAKGFTPKLSLKPRW
jgi:hypothetical protein